MGTRVTEGGMWDRMQRAAGSSAPACSALVEIVGFDATAQTVTVQFPYPIINDGFVVGQAAELRWIVSPNAGIERPMKPQEGRSK